MFHKSSILFAKMATAMSLAMSVSAIHAANADTSLVTTVETALHDKLDGHGRGIRVQVIDGTVYLYGTVETYSERASIEDVAIAAAAGHKVVDSIEFPPNT